MIRLGLAIWSLYLVFTGGIITALVIGVIACLLDLALE